MKKRWHSPLSQEDCLFQIRFVIGDSLWFGDHWKTGLQGEVSGNKFKFRYKIAFVSGNLYRPLSGTVEPDPINGGSIITIESKLSDFIFNKYGSIVILLMTTLVFILNNSFTLRDFFWGIVFTNILFNSFIIISNTLGWLFQSADKTYTKFKIALMDNLQAKEIE